MERVTSTNHKNGHWQTKHAKENLKNSPNKHTNQAIDNGQGKNKSNAVKSIAKLCLQDQKRQLPIFEHKSKLLELIEKHETLIILGETGCGKTTQIPQYIYSAGLHGIRRIGITQPRRVAAISIAMRVAQELGGKMGVGETVGYSVRFEDVTSKKTKIKYLTDGMLLREAMMNDFLMSYSFIILDEAHERSLHTDVLFGVIKMAQRKRRLMRAAPLKVLIMSATMDVDHFSKYFDNCQVVYLEGRTFPINIFHSIKRHEDYQSACVATFFKIHREAPPNHDVLIFLTGQEEIEVAAHQIRTLSKDPEVEGPPLIVLSLYAAQSSSQQMNVFQPTPIGSRKVILSTNIAETSLTISGIRYVIDSGMVKIRTFHPNTGLETLKVNKISHEQAWQRAGRAGRESEGFCYRLYTTAEFELMPKSSIPEVQRSSLSSTILNLISMEMHPMLFDFMSEPSRDTLAAALEELMLLGAIDNLKVPTLTELGQKMVRFPLHPRYSKILLAAQEYKCIEEALIIVAFLSSESVLLNPINWKEKVHTVRQKFRSGYGDHVTLLNMYREFSNVGQNNKRAWCHEHFISLRNMLMVREVRTQLETICLECKLQVSSCGSQMDHLRKCLISGLFMNVAEVGTDRQYITCHKKQSVAIHPSSVLYGQSPHLVLFTEVVETSRSYIRGLSTVEVSWLSEVAPSYFSKVKLRRE